MRLKQENAVSNSTETTTLVCVKLTAMPAVSFTTLLHLY